MAKIGKNTFGTAKSTKIKTVDNRGCGAPGTKMSGGKKSGKKKY